MPTGRVIEIEPDTHAVSEYPTGITPLGAALPLNAGYLLVGSEGIWKWTPNGPVILWAAIPQETGVVSNDALLYAGGVWVGRMDVSERPGTGSLWRISPGAARLVSRGLTLPNGLVSTTDGRGVLFAESVARRVYRIPADAHSLDLSSMAVYRDVPDWTPDGLAKDHLGNLWVARWGEGTVTRFRTASLPQLDVHVPTAQATAAAFDPLGVMYITTARENFDTQQRLIDPLAGSVFTAPVVNSGHGERF